MQAFKQLGGGLLLGLISLIVVIGGISLALAEGYVPQPAPRLESPTSEFPTSEFVNGTLDFLLSPWPSETPFLPSTLALTNTPTLPPTPVSCPAPDGWMPIYVGPGETLEMIAARYQTTTSILIEGNCLPSTTILPGIPLYVPLPAGSTSIVVSTSTTCGHPSTWIQYTVQSGDTLYRISQLYRTTVTELQNANCLGGSTSIYAGQKLWVPNVATSTPLITATILTIEFNTATLAPTSATEPPPTATTAPPPTATTAPPPTATTAPPPTSTPSPTTSPQ